MLWREYREAYEGRETAPIFPWIHESSHPKVVFFNFLAIRWTFQMGGKIAMFNPAGRYDHDPKDDEFGTVSDYTLGILQSARRTYREEWLPMRLEDTREHFIRAMGLTPEVIANVFECEVPEWLRDPDAPSVEPRPGPGPADDPEEPADRKPVENEPLRESGSDLERKPADDTKLPSRGVRPAA
jgi:hypothetical protein